MKLGKRQHYRKTFAIKTSVAECFNNKQPKHPKLTIKANTGGRTTFYMQPNLLSIIDTKWACTLAQLYIQGTSR